MRELDKNKRMYYDGTGKFPAGTASASRGNCEIVKWKEPDEQWGFRTEFRMDDGKYISMPHADAVQFLSSPVADYLGMVREFHERFNLCINENPTLIDNGPAFWHLCFVGEKFKEYGAAVANDDLAGIANTLAELLYAVFGSVVAYGLPMDEIFLGLHESKMEGHHAD